MMHLYSAFCVLLYTQSALQSCGGVSPQPPPVCSIHLDDAMAATGQRCQCARHTPATDGEESNLSYTPKMNENKFFIAHMFTTLYSFIKFKKVKSCLIN